MIVRFKLSNGSVGAALLALALFGGCDRRKYEITMQRHPDGKIERNLTVGTENDGIPRETSKAILDKLREIYGVPESQPSERTHFAGQFETNLPADTARDEYVGHGVVTALTSPLGSTCYYLERVPGPSDPWDMLEAAKDVLDLSLRALMAHLESLPELKEKHALLERMRTILLTEVRHDALNVLLMVWRTMQPAAAEEPMSEELEREVTGRVLSYLHEHGYVDDTNFPGLDYGRLLKSGARHKVTLALGDSAREFMPIAEKLLGEGSALNDAIEHGLTLIHVTREEFDAKSRQVFRVFGDETTIEMTLKTGIKPTYTNGKWDAEGGQVTWRVSGVSPPFLAPAMFAVWPEPNETFQRSHLGSVRLREKLPKYNDWRIALSEPDRKRWDDFVSSLAASVPLEERLDEFKREEIKTHSQSSTQPTIGPLEDGLRFLRFGDAGN